MGARRSLTERMIIPVRDIIAEWIKEKEITSFDQIFKTINGVDFSKMTGIPYYRFASIRRGKSIFNTEDRVRIRKAFKIKAGDLDRFIGRWPEK